MTWTPENEAELRHLLRRAVIRDGFRTATCAGKDSFRSAQLARSAAPKNNNGPVSIYRCKSCGKWHIGSHIGPKARNKSKRIRTRNGSAIGQEETSDV